MLRGSYNYTGLPLNKEVGTQELLAHLGMSQSTWKKKRQEAVEELKKRYEFEIIGGKGRATFFIFKDTKEYIEKTKETVFEQAIMKEIESRPRNTPANIARRILDDEDIKELNYAKSTVYQYTRVRINKWFGKEVEDVSAWSKEGRKGYIKEKIWCMLDRVNNEYIPMTEEQKTYFFSFIRDEMDKCAEEIAEIFSDCETGVKEEQETKDEVFKTMQSSVYALAKNQFYAEYGYFPYKVPVYIKFAEE